MKDEDIKWAAQVSHVQEVTLLGTADLGYWATRLKREDLLPDDRDGRAHVMIVGAALKWRGVRFRELSISVLARAVSGSAEQKGAFLLQAWSSSRFFAACERMFFSTPYTYGNVRTSTAEAASIQLVVGGEIAFYAQRRADGPDSGAPPSAPVHGSWSGPVFLPGNAKAAANDRRKLFFARAEGLSESRPFLPDRDGLAIGPSRGCETLAALVDSHFVAEAWVVRRDATHAKSKTYARDEALS